MMYFVVLIAAVGTKTASKCFSVAGVPTLEFNKCRLNEMIIIHEAFQGISQKVSINNTTK